MSLVIDENLNLAILHHTNAGICSSKIDTDNCIVEESVIGILLGELRIGGGHTSSIALL